jgi:60 kDa SS-A/Ro ribonucleoprotein
VVKGLAAAEEKAAQAEDQGEAEAVLAYLRAVEQMKRCTDAGECAALIVDHRLAREHVPSSLLSSGPVWAALLQGMPLTALTRNLAKMTAVGLIAPGSEAAALVCRRLGDAAALRKARVHPFSVLLAHKTYAAGQGDKGSLTWQPAAEVVAALDKAFQLAFAAVVPAGKRFLLVRSFRPSSHPAATLLHRTPHINSIRFSLAMGILWLRQGPRFRRSTFPARWAARWARATCTAGAAGAR